MRRRRKKGGGEMAKIIRLIMKMRAEPSPLSPALQAQRTDGHSMGGGEGPGVRGTGPRPGVGCCPLPLHSPPHPDPLPPPTLRQQEIFCPRAGGEGARLARAWSLTLMA